MITDEIIRKSKKRREFLEAIEEETQMAAASYCAGMALWEYIYPFSSNEPKDKYRDRKRQTIGHYVPYTRLISARYLENIFGNEVVRETGDPLLDKYLEDYYSDWFEKEVARPALYIPEMYVYVTPKIIPDAILSEYNRPLTKAEEDQLGIYPQCHVVYPQYAYSLDETETGDLNWIRFKFDDCDLIIDHEEIVRIEKGQPVKRIQHGFGEIPVHRIAYERNNFYKCKFGLAPLSAIPTLSIALLQVIGMYIESIYTAMSYPMVTSPMTASASDVTGIGNETILLEDEKFKGITRYLEVPLAQVNSLLTFAYEKGPRVIYEAARMIDRNTTVSAQQAASGLSKAFDFIPENNAVKDISKWLRRIDDKLIRLQKIGTMNVATDYHISYPKSFGAKTHTEVIQEVTAVIENLNSGRIPKSDKGIKLMLINAYKSFLPELSPEEQQMIEDEINRWKEQDAALANAAIDPFKTNNQQGNENQKSKNPPTTAGDVVQQNGQGSTNSSR